MDFKPPKKSYMTVHEVREMREHAHLPSLTGAAKKVSHVGRKGLFG